MSPNQQLAQNFQNLLIKLSNPSTKNIATKQLETLIQSNQSSEDLQTYLSILQHNHRNNDGKQSQMEVLVIGYISSIYQDRLRIKDNQKDDHIYTAFQFIKIIIGCLKFGNDSIIECCFKSLSMLYLNSLQSINSGSDLVIQLNSSKLLNMLFRMFRKYNQYDLLYHISTKFTNIFMKVGQQQKQWEKKKELNNPLVNNVMDGMRILIQTLGLNRFNNIVHKIVNKTIKNINVSRYQSLLLLTTIGQLYLNDRQTHYMMGIDYQQIRTIMQTQKRTNQQNIQQISQQGEVIWKQIENEQERLTKNKKQIRNDKCIDVDMDYDDIHQDVVGQYYQKQTDVPSNGHVHQMQQDLMDQVDIFNMKKQYLHKNKQKQTKGYSHQEQQQKIQNYIQKMRIMNMDDDPDQDDYIEFNQKPIINKIKKEQIEQDQYLNQFRKQQQVQVDLDDTVDMNDDYQQDYQQQQNYEDQQYKIQKNFNIDDQNGLGAQAVDKKDKQQQQNQSISQQWQYCLSLLNESPDKSFQNTLSLNDDLYLLRLCLIYQQQQQQKEQCSGFLQNLSTGTAVELIQRLSRLQQSKLIERLVSQFYRLVIQKVGVKQLTIEQRRNIIESLKEIRSRQGIDQQSIDELIQEYS